MIFIGHDFIFIPTKFNGFFRRSKNGFSLKFDVFFFILCIIFFLYFYHCLINYSKGKFFLGILVIIFYSTTSAQGRYNHSNTSVIRGKFYSMLYWHVVYLSFCSKCKFFLNHIRFADLFKKRRTPMRNGHLSVSKKNY